MVAVGEVHGPAGNRDHTSLLAKRETCVLRVVPGCGQ